MNCAVVTYGENKRCVKLLLRARQREHLHASGSLMKFKPETPENIIEGE